MPTEPWGQSPGVSSGEGGRASRPHLVVLGGCNGAGKSTAAPWVLQGALGVHEFIDADVIARGLSGFQPESAAIEAGRAQLDRIELLVQRRADFALESTLSGRSLAMLLRRLRGEEGYDVHLVYLWLASVDVAVERVRWRTAQGGHGVLEETIRRRYERGLRNFGSLYRPLATSWRAYDASLAGSPRLIAAGSGVEVHVLQDEASWARITSGESDVR